MASFLKPTASPPDFPLMGAGEFERILGEKLRLGGPPPSGHPQPAPSFTPAWESFQTSPFLAWHPDTAIPGAAAAFRRFGPKGIADSARRPAQATLRGKNARGRRALTPEGYAALDALRSLGADALDESFTVLDLKRAFRALALRYHPDRHPSGSPDLHRDLARAFGRIHQSYRTLLAHVR